MLIVGMKQQRAAELQLSGWIKCWRTTSSSGSCVLSITQSSRLEKTATTRNCERCGSQFSTSTKSISFSKVTITLTVALFCRSCDFEEGRSGYGGRRSQIWCERSANDCQRCDWRTEAGRNDRHCLCRLQSVDPRCTTCNDRPS